MESAIQVDTKIDEIIRDNKIFRFALELQNTEDESRKELIKYKLLLLQGVSKEEMVTNAKNKLDNIYDNINTFTLKQKWTRLTDKQKKERISNYIKSSKLSDDKKDLLTDKITNMMKNKTFKAQFITYNSDEGKIDNITIPDFKLELSDDDDSSDLSESELSSSGSD